MKTGFCPLKNENVTKIKENKNKTKYMKDLCVHSN